MECKYMLLNDFCITIDKALNEMACDDLIKIFKSNTDKHEKYNDELTPKFTQFDFTLNKELNLDLHSYIIHSSLKYVSIYKNSISETSFWPKDYGFEHFRIKHYQNGNNDQFADHVDAVDVSSMRRFFAFFWYLNDVEEGGETEFLNFDLKIKPKKGTLFMFPPLWLYPHRGNPPISNEKYLLSSYLHFNS